MRIGFIGLGIMGSAMAHNLIKSNFDLTVYNRTREKEQSLIDKGAKSAASLPELAENCDIIITMLSTPEAVAKIALGDDGFINSMQKNSIWINCSTVNPSFTEMVFRRAQERNIRFIDAPVAGSKIPAEQAKLTILVGADKNDFDECKNIFESVGEKVLHIGEVGKGSAMKMVINLMLGVSMGVFSEAVNLGKAMGINEDILFSTLIGGPVTAPFIAFKKDKLQNQNFDAEFPLQWMRKDLQLVSQTAYENNFPLTLGNSVKELYAFAQAHGLGEQDFSSVYKLLDEYSRKGNP